MNLFKDHLIFPAKVQNQTQRPKMSLILPASMANLNSMFFEFGIRIFNILF